MEGNFSNTEGFLFFCSSMSADMTTFIILGRKIRFCVTDAAATIKDAADIFAGGFL